MPGTDVNRAMVTAMKEPNGRTETLDLFNACLLVQQLFQPGLL
jgi:hypothetical protein